MLKKYDVCIVGAGPGGIFTALTLLDKNPNLKIVMLDKGKPLESRARKGLDLTCGFAGAGAYSDGKIIYSLDQNYGGNLQDYVKDLNLFSDLMKKVDDKFMKFAGSEIPIFGDDEKKVSEIKLKAARNGMSLLLGKVRHCGTDENFTMMKNIYEYLKDKIDILLETEVRSFDKTGDVFAVYYTPPFDPNKHNTAPVETYLECKYLVLMPGRTGNKWFSNLAKEKSLKTVNNMIDIGVRIEFPNWVGKEIDEVLYEPKLVIRTPKTDLKTRTFCYNPDGFCVQESIKDDDGTEIITVNGHSNSSKGERSSNTNFALLVSTMFTEPFNNPSQYGISVAKLCNLLGGGSPLVQRLKDLKNNVRSTRKRMTEMNLQPTLTAAEPGDLRFALPANQIEAILESIEILDKLMPGLNGDDTLLYAPEIKFYSVRAVLNNKLETEIENLYGGGDGLGVTRGIAQSSASGIVVANSILDKLENRK